MAVIMEKAIFYHVPKTGGTWVRRALLRGTKVLLVMQGHPTQEAFDYNPLFKFAFVRHPVSWYRSYWTYKQKVKWIGLNGGLDNFRDQDFNKFMEKCLKYKPGFYSGMIAKVVGEGLDFIGKQENLVEDLLKALRLAGQECDEQIIRETPPANVSIIKPEMNPKIEKQIMVTENDIIKKYY